MNPGFTGCRLESSCAYRRQMIGTGPRGRRGTAGPQRSDITATSTASPSWQPVRTIFSMDESGPGRPIDGTPTPQVRRPLWGHWWTEGQRRRDPRRRRVDAERHVILLVQCVRQPSMWSHDRFCGDHVKWPFVTETCEASKSRLVEPHDECAGRRLTTSALRCAWAPEQRAPDCIPADVLRLAEIARPPRHRHVQSVGPESRDPRNPSRNGPISH